jgi:excisionase family DNA binding protein
MPNASPTPPILLRVGEAADLLSVSRRTFYDLLTREPKLRSATVQLSGLKGMRIRRDLLEAAIAELTTPGTD